MSSKLIISLIIVVVIVAGIFVYTNTKPNEKIIQPQGVTYATEASQGIGQEEPIPVDECPDKARFVIEQKGFTDIHLCQQEELTIDGKTVWFVKIAYGPGMDCPSGCFYAMFQGIVDGTEIHELGFAPSISSSTFIHEVCGSETKIVKYKDTYKWAVLFEGNPGGKAVYLRNETIADPKYEHIYNGWDTTELIINEYTNPVKCVDGSCSYFSYQSMDFDDFMKVKGNGLFNNLGIDTSQLQHTYNRLTSQPECVNGNAVADIEVLDNKDHCKHKFNLYLDGSNDEYLGCEPERGIFAQISADKTEVNINEEIQLTITAFPSKMEICDPYLTILYEIVQQTTEPQPIQEIGSSNYYIDYRREKVYIGQNWNVFEPEQHSIGCKEDSQFTLTKKVKFDKKGEYRIEAHINSIGTQNSVTIAVN